MYEYDDGGEGGRSPARILAVLVVVAAIAALGWFVVKPRLSSDDAPQPPLGGASTVAASAEASTTTLAPATTTASSAPTTVALPPTTVPVAAGYDALPDGSPVPVVAIFDVGVVTLNGVVPDQAAVDRLGGLALANSRDPATTRLVNNLIVNPAVPTNVGVRVIELTSTRFPEASAEILLLHAAELNRIVAVMNALPNVSVLVVGHADQRGNEAANFAISEARARSVVNYLASQGIDPSRLSSRAVGEADLLSINNDAASLALNRRTEFIVYGLLLE